MARPKKLIRFKLAPFKNSTGTTSWRVSGTKPTGERVRKNYSDKLEALQAISDLELAAEGTTERRQAIRTSLSHQELADAEAALQRVSSEKLSEVVAHYQGLRARAQRKGVDLDQALSFVESRYRPETREVSILNATDEFLNTRTDLTKHTERHYRNGLRLLLSPDPNKPVHAIGVSDLERVLSAYKNSTSKRTYRRTFSVFFNWAVRHHYCLEDPCKRLDRQPKQMTRIEVLDLDEIKRLLWAAANFQGGSAAASIAIGLFAGLRPSELAALSPIDIAADRIKVAGGKLRRTLKRSVPIPPVLKAWLADFPFEGHPKGWDYKFKALKKATKARRWVHDIIRHTSISFQTERDKNEPLTAFNNGTSVKMMDDHYRNTIDSEKQIAEFWKLTPSKIKAAKPDVNIPERIRIKWPEDVALELLVWKKPLVHAAKDLGISNVALRNHCIKVGIKLPNLGYWLRQSASSPRRRSTG